MTSGPSQRGGVPTAFAVLPAGCVPPAGLAVVGRLDRLDLAVPLVSRMGLEVLVVSQRLVDAESAWPAVESLAAKEKTAVWVVLDGDGRDRGNWRTWAARVITNQGAEAQEASEGTPWEVRRGDRHHTVVVLGAKGGAGKTFVAANLIASLALRGVAVSGVDLDFEAGDLALRMGCEPKLDLGRVASQPESAAGCGAYRSGPRIALWAAPSRPELASLASEAVVRSVLEAASRSAQVTVVDTPADADQDGTYLALEAATSVLLVTTLNPAMVRQCRVMLELMRRLNFPVRDSLGLVLNRVRRRSLVSAGAACELIGQAALVGLPDLPGLADSEAYYGRPSVLAHPRGTLSRRLELVAARVFPGGRTAPRRRWPWTRSETSKPAPVREWWSG